MKISTYRFLIITIIISIYTNQISAQISINYTGDLPDSSSILDISSTNSGILIPRIALTDTSDATTIAGPATSLMVYNTTTGGGLVPGYYYNDGTPAAPHWILLFTSPAIVNLNMSNLKIVNLATCTDDHDAVNKAYVDALVAGGGGGGGTTMPTMISDESATNYNYREAAQYCRNLTEGGYTDWRMSNIEEFWYVYSYSSNPVPNETSSNYFWLNELNGPNQRYYLVELSSGYLAYSVATNLYRARCVR